MTIIPRAIVLGGGCDVITMAHQTSLGLVEMLNGSVFQPIKQLIAW